MMARSPSLIGHSRSTLVICSQRSADVLMSRMRPYLTWRRTYAPSSMSWDVFPVALMTSSSPLFPGR